MSPEKKHNPLERGTPGWRTGVDEEKTCKEKPGRASTGEPGFGRSSVVVSSSKAEGQMMVCLRLIGGVG